MKKVVIFLVIFYILSAIGAWTYYSKNSSISSKIVDELTVAKSDLIATKTALDAEKATREILEKKVADARVNATFLALALCPTLEATNKDALCVKSGSEWLSETIVSGTLLTEPNAKEKMEALLVALGKKTKPTSKQLYEMLRPIELHSLNALGDNLK